MRGRVTTALFRAGGQHPFYQHLPLMMLFSVSCPSPLATLSSSQPPTGLPGLPSCAKPHHNHTLLAEAGPSPVPSGQFGSRQAPMAIVTPPTFPFPSSLLPRHLHPIPLPSLARGVTLGSQHPGARRCSPASSPSCCRGVCSPACARHAAPVIRTPPCTTSIVH